MSSQVQERLTKAMDPSAWGRAELSAPKITSIMQITKSLFPESTIEVELEADPSEPDFHFVVFKVLDCDGEIDELLSNETEWNRRVRETNAGESGQLRLLICPVA